jgi:hypothetical protein
MPEVPILRLRVAIGAQVRCFVEQVNTPGTVAAALPKVQSAQSPGLAKPPCVGVCPPQGEMNRWKNLTSWRQIGQLNFELDSAIRQKESIHRQLSFCK